MSEIIDPSEDFMIEEHILVPNDILNDFLDGKITGEQFKLLSKDFKTAEIRA